MPGSRDVRADNRRLGSDAYTASAQRRSRTGSDDWKEEYVGRLRFDLLLSETIVIPDTHLWDGVLMLDLGPAELAKAVGRGIEEPSVPFEIRVRPRKERKQLKYGLDISLADFFLDRKDRSTLNIWKLNFLSDEMARVALRDELQGKSARGLERALASHSSVVDGVVHFLGRHLDGLGFATDDLEAAGRRWKEWVAFEGRVGVEPWRGVFDIHDALERNPIAEEDLTPFGWSWYQDVLAKVAQSPNRASVEPLFDKMWAEATTPEERLDAQTIENWYSEGRHRALALQHETNWDYFQRTDGSPVGVARKLVFPRSNYIDLLVGNNAAGPVLVPAKEGDEVERSLRYRGVTVPAGMREGLAQMDAELFRLLVAEVHSSHRAWAEAGDVDSLKRILDEAASKIGNANARPEFFAKAFWYQAAAIALAEGLDKLRFAGLVALVATEKTRQVIERSSERSVIEYFHRRTGKH